MSKVLRWTIPNDGADHTVEFVGGISNIVTATGVGPQAYIEFWTHRSIFNNSEVANVRTFRMFKNDDEIPEGYLLVGVTPKIGTTVFYLFEKRDIETEVRPAKAGV